MTAPDEMPGRAEIAFTRRGSATGRMRNEIEVAMVRPSGERSTLATGEGPFHGGDATAPPPLAPFVGGLSGCPVTQIHVSAKRLGVTVTGPDVECRAVWDWARAARVHETAPGSFAIDATLSSPDPLEAQRAPIDAAGRGCVSEQALGRANTVRRRLRTPDGFVDA